MKPGSFFPRNVKFSIPIFIYFLLYVRNIDIPINMLYSDVSVRYLLHLVRLDTYRAQQTEIYSAGTLKSSLLSLKGTDDKERKGE